MKVAGVVAGLALVLAACGSPQDQQGPEPSASEAERPEPEGTPSPAPTPEPPAIEEPARTIGAPPPEPAQPVAPAPGAQATLPTPPPVVEPAAAANPPAAFAACRSCHTTERGGAHRIGPNLFGVVNARAGRHAEFAYSDAMAEAEFVWSPERLDSFLAAPRDDLPGNRMMAAPVRDDQARREIIAYLASLQ